MSTTIDYLPLIEATERAKIKMTPTGWTTGWGNPGDFSPKCLMGWLGWELEHDTHALRPASGPFVTNPTPRQALAQVAWQAAARVMGVFPRMTFNPIEVNDSHGFERAHRVLDEMLLILRERYREQQAAQATPVEMPEPETVQAGAEAAQELRELVVA